MADSEDPSPKPRTPRRSRSSPTIADVARAAGVSSMTVSRVINRDPRVLAATRERVDTAVAELGYVPNPAARSLAGGRQCRIALLHSNPSAAYLSAFLMGSLEEASLSDAQLIVEQSGEGEGAAPLVARLTAHRVDAVLLPPPLCDDTALLAALRKAGKPFVQVATGAPDPAALSVTIDDEAAAHAMTSRLIGQGHRRIGFITGNANQTASGRRLAGYQRALSEHGLPEVRELIEIGTFTYRSGMDCAERLLGLAVRPTAVFASNDDMAAAVVAVAHRRGLDVPGDLSVCGFDDTAIATTIWPELTTIRQPIGEMARIATRLLIARVQDGLAGAAAAPVGERLPFDLVARGTDAALHSPSPPE